MIFPKLPLQTFLDQEYGQHEHHNHCKAQIKRYSSIALVLACDAEHSFDTFPDIKLLPSAHQAQQVHWCKCRRLRVLEQPIIVRVGDLKVLF